MAVTILINYLFGILSTAEHLQKQMNNILKGKARVLCHMDDIEEHDNRLHKVLQKLQSHEEILNKQKSEFIRQMKMGSLQTLKTHFEDGETKVTYRDVNISRDGRPAQSVNS